MDMIQFGAACEVLERVEAFDKLEDANTQRAAHHAEPKEWEKWIKRWKKAIKQPKKTAEQFLSDFKSGKFKQ